MSSNLLCWQFEETLAVPRLSALQNLEKKLEDINNLRKPTFFEFFKDPASKCALLLLSNFFWQVSWAVLFLKN